VLLKSCLFTIIICIGSCLFPTGYAHAQQQPRLVIGITVDQMRWDYLYRFEHRWHEKGGFRRLLDSGFVCNNLQINYLPSYTACGHATIYTGTVPAIHGITGNSWWDAARDKYVYCTNDDKVMTVGSSDDAGHMSPVHLLTTTIADELRLATNFRGKTIGISLKDRGGILAVGQSANAAYWYDGDAGEWITSTWYMNTLPAWVKGFNSKGKVDSFYRQGWDLLLPKETYVQSNPERKSYEIRTFGTSQRQMPYYLERFENVSYDIITTTPFGNTLTTEFAKATIISESLGKDSIPDLLAISYSSPDYIGHAYGPNSMELEDTYLRFDLELGDLLNFLDKQVGENQYVVFLSSDHGTSHVPGFLNENKLPGGHVSFKKMQEELNMLLKEKFGVSNLIKTFINDQVLLDMPVIEKNRKLDFTQIVDQIIPFLEKQEGIARAVAIDKVFTSTIDNDVRQRIANGYYPARSGHVQLIFKPGYIEGFLRGGTTHSTGYAYDTHIPLIFYGKHIPVGKTEKQYLMTDIAPSLAALLNIQVPNGCIGEVITELFD
jgi:predicted AlkP superfamily pyrophosphatase or phosphodiesterase